jgi:hypothetical protein
MKLRRYGPKVYARPGILYDDGQIRDLSAETRDISQELLFPLSLNRLRRLNLNSLPLVTILAINRTEHGGAQGPALNLGGVASLLAGIKS